MGMNEGGEVAFNPHPTQSKVKHSQDNRNDKFLVKCLRKLFMITDALYYHIMPDRLYHKNEMLKFV